MITPFCWGLLNSITWRYFGVLDAGRVHTAICVTSSPEAVLTRRPASFTHMLPKGCLLFHEDLQNLGSAQFAHTAMLQHNNILCKTKWPVFSELLC